MCIYIYICIYTYTYIYILNNILKQRLAREGLQEGTDPRQQNI